MSLGYCGVVFAASEAVARTAFAALESCLRLYLFRLADGVRAVANNTCDPTRPAAGQELIWDEMRRVAYRLSRVAGMALLEKYCSIAGMRSQVYGSGRRIIDIEPFNRSHLSCRDCNPYEAIGIATDLGDAVEETLLWNVGDRVAERP